MFTSNLLSSDINPLLSIFQDILKDKSNTDIADLAQLSSFVVLGIFAFLIIYLFVLKSSKNKLARKQAANEQDLQNLPTGIVTLDTDGRILNVNGYGAKLLGREIDKLKGLNFAELFRTEEKDNVNDALNAEEAKIQATARASNLILGINLGQMTAASGYKQRRITLFDINNLQRAYSKEKQTNRQTTQLLQQSQLGRLTGNLKDKQLKLDDIAQTICCHYDHKKTEVELGQVSERVHPADVELWKRLLDNFALKGQANEQLRLLTSDCVPNDENLTFSLCQLKLFAIGEPEEGRHNAFEAIISTSPALAEKTEQLVFAENRYQAMLNATPNPMYIINDAGQIIQHNHPFSSLARIVNPKANSQNLFDMGVLPDQALALHKSTNQLSNFAQQIECKLECHDGRVLQIRLFVSFFKKTDYLAKTETRYAIGTIVDLTQLVDAKQQLDEERAQLDNLLSLAPVAIATIDAEDRVIMANHQMLERLKYSEGELKHGNFYQLFADAAQAGTAAKKLSQTGQLRGFHAKLKDKENKLHPSELHIDLINREKQEYLCWIADRSDEQFQQDKFESLLENSSMPMAILGNDGFSKVNEAATNFFAARDEYELRNLMPYSTNLNADEYKADELKRLIDQIKLTGKVFSHTWEYQVGETKLPCEATFVPIFKDKQLESILCIWMDKRELKKIDQARIEAINLQQAAQREIQEKQKLLSNSQDQLADKMRSLANTEQKLRSVQVQFDETRSEYTQLKEQHESVNENLMQLQHQYTQSRNMLADAQQANQDLQQQLDSSSEQVKGLNHQREQIAEALRQSEDRYKDAKAALALSEENARELQSQLQDEKGKMNTLIGQMTKMKNAVSDKDAQIHQVSNQIQALQSQLTSSTNVTENLKQQLENQRKASEEAQKQKRQIEETYNLAQAELRTKERHLEHMQSEMQKLEEMSNQEKGDMQAQQEALKQELLAKQDQLQSTKDALLTAQQAAEQEKQARDQQEAELKKLQHELSEAETHAAQKQAEMAQKEQQRRELQEKLARELKAKQLQLQQTEQVLSQSKQQTEAEKAEKEQQRQLYEKLKGELKDIEQRSAEQEAKINQSDEQWQKDKSAMREEIDAKREQLLQTKTALDDIQQQADKERLTRIEQEQKLKQLALELSDVEQRAQKQQQMLESSEEQWHKHHAEIEQQKQQLQKALAEATEQNQMLQGQLTGKLDALKQAENQVTESQTGEQALQQELEQARAAREALEEKIASQAEKEKQLQQQLSEQQQAIEAKEASIHELEGKQKALADELAKVQQDYAQSKESLSNQHDSHSNLSTQLEELEKALADSKQLLADKENALQKAQSDLQDSQSKLSEQEEALISAHKQELEDASKEEGAARRRPQIEKLDMPPRPTDWFDLLPYLQKQGEIESLPKALAELIDGLESNLSETESAIVENDVSGIFRGTKELIRIAHEVNSEVLTDMLSDIENDCKSGMVDNVSIRWPAAKQSLEKTLRVVYSHLHG